MMLRILLLVAAVHGAAIPQNPSCLEKCLVAGGIVGAAADLNFFKSVAVDINNFCNVYTALLKCASGCSQDDLNLVMKHTMHASYVCKDKLEEVKTVHDCLESDTTDPLSDCSKVCEVTEHVPLRLDSTATAPVNPNVPAEGTGPLCGKQMCVLKCAREQLNKQCAGAGDLFKEIARHQVEIGWDMLQAQSENTNDTASQLVALSYLANIPEKCVYLTNLETFDKEIGGDSMKKQEMMPGMEFSNDTMTETAESSAEPATGASFGGFDPTLFEFAPALEPDVPLGPPSEGPAGTTDASTKAISSFPEEEVKVLGDKTTTIVVEEQVTEEPTTVATVPEQSTTVPTEDATVASTTVPTEETTTTVDAVSSSEEPNTTADEATVPTAETTTVPEQSTTVAAEEATVPTTTVATITTTARDSQSGSSLAAAVDAAATSMDKTMDAGVHEQPKPAEAPAASETDESVDAPAESVDAAATDKESAMGPRPITAAPGIPEGGLIASRPVTEEDKDKEEEEEESGPGEMAKATDAKTASAESKDEAKAEDAESTDETAEGEKTEMGATKTGESTDGKTVEASKEEGDMADNVGDEVEKEIEDGAAANKDSEGAEMTTDATIVVDDENESELEKNVVTTVTEKAKVNAAPGSITTVSALAALVAVMFL